MHRTHVAERRAMEISGVLSARGSSRTGNLLVRFDPQATDAERILGVLAEVEDEGAGARGQRPQGDRAPETSGTGETSGGGLRDATTKRLAAVPRGAAAVPKVLAAVPKGAAAVPTGIAAVPKGAAAVPRGTAAVPGGVAGAPRHAVREVGRLRRRARIAVRGIDRDPEVARRVVERLGRLPGVSRVTASQLTGRVMVEYSAHLLDIEDLLSHVTNLELPPLPNEDAPSHPLDPGPLIQSTARVIGSGLGLGLVGIRRALASGEGAPTGRRAAQVAGAVGIVEGLPPVEQRLERLLGHHGAQLALSGLSIVGLTFAGNPLGLAVTGAAALRLMSTVRARRAAWRRYEQRLEEAEPANPGAEVELEPGERAPLPGTVLRGYGTAISASGEVLAVAPGARLDAGARLHGGPVTLRLDTEKPFVPEPRSTPPTPTIYDRYLSALPPASLAGAALTGLVTRSAGAALTALLLINPRVALIGAESADNGAAARVLRQGITVVGSRERRPISLPDAVIIESPRVLIDGLQLAEVTVGTAAAATRSGATPAATRSGTAAVTGSGAAAGDACDEREVVRIAAAVSAAAGSPWGPIFNHQDAAEASDGTFDGRVASAEIDGERWLLGPARSQPPTRYLLELRLARRSEPAGRLALRLAPAPGLRQLVDTCRRLEVPLEVVAHAAAPAAALSDEHGVPELEGDALDRVRQIQARGGIVAVVSDRSHAGPEFAECDLAIGLTSGRSGHFAARADLLAPDLSSVAAILDAGARRDRAVRDSVLLSTAANLAGAVWGLSGNPRFEGASQATYIGALGAIAVGYARLRGGARARSVTQRLSDPEPERFGRLSVEDALAALDSRWDGLTDEEAAARVVRRRERHGRGPLIGSILDQLNSPLNAILGGGAVLSLALGAVGDVAMIAAVIAANTVVGVWQERAAGRAAEALERMSARTARVLRDGELVTVDARELVPGDVILLGPGDRVPADARLLEADELEVDEAALTGESIPVEKLASGGTEANRIVLEGSDVTVGSGRALVVAVGRGTRMGATAAAVAIEETRSSPLGQRLSRMFSEGLPLIVGGGALVTVAGVLWGRPFVPQLALGASVAIGAVPEGLPLLAGVAQAAVARRLAARHALVRRLAAVEALGRVDVACADKTGTLTEGHPALTCVSDPDGHHAAPERLSEDLRRVLEAAALASPHPDSPSLAAHPTDVAVLAGAERAGLRAPRELERDDEQPFEPSRGFHATRAGGRLVLKGAAEVLAPRCTAIRRGASHQALNETGRDALLATVERLSSQGLRVLMVAEAPPDASLEDPQRLTALGFIGISDPLRAGVRAAVQRCERAGVRVMMLTGDHPATAEAVARQAGLSQDGVELLTGEELGSLSDEELDRRLESTRVIARISPLDKLRIVEALQRRGHVVAMTGDGVNDAPALRLADVGVAMGRGGTDVAREAADLILADDDFATLVETFVEGRGFWHNIRRALALLLGGNLGELGLMVAAGVSGLASPLTTRQVLAVNLVTDVLPALSVAVQQPEHRDLAALSREGTAALDRPLRRGILNRGAATALPSFLAYALSFPIPDQSRRRAVAFTAWWPRSSRRRWTWAG